MDFSSSSTWGNLKGTQVTVSEGHPWRSRDKRMLGDVGGDFFTQRKYVRGKSQPIRLTNDVSFANAGRIITDHSRYDGPIAPTNPANLLFPPANNSSNGVLNTVGATAIARCKPTNSVANLTTALTELYHEGIPKAIGARFWQSRTLSARNAGDEYLNLEFGWKPLVGDIRSLANAVANADALLAQYERDAGKVVRRRYNFPTNSSRSTEVFAANVRPYVTTTQGTYTKAEPNLGSVIRTRETVLRQWFSGAFTYYLPTGYDSRSSAARSALLAKKILGLSLTPDIVWNLTPWSWAVDWFSNTGDVISNLTDWATDGLVLRYGYVMEHTITSDTYTYSGNTGLIDGNVRVPPLTLVTETKIRRRANPFGFGITWDGLSPRQLAITAALGLTR